METSSPNWSSSYLRLLLSTIGRECIISIFNFARIRDLAKFSQDGFATELFMDSDDCVLIDIYED